MYVTRMYSCGVLVTILQSLLATETEIYKLRSDEPLDSYTPTSTKQAALKQKYARTLTEDNLTLRLRDQRTQQAERSICKRASCKSLQMALNATFQREATIKRPVQLVNFFSIQTTISGNKTHINELWLQH